MGWRAVLAGRRRPWFRTRQTVSSGASDPPPSCTRIIGDLRGPCVRRQDPRHRGRRTAKPFRRNRGHESAVREMPGGTGSVRSGARIRPFPPTRSNGARFGGDAYGPMISRGRRRAWRFPYDAAAIRSLSRCAGSWSAKGRSPWPSSGSTNGRRRAGSC